MVFRDSALLSLNKRQSLKHNLVLLLYDHQLVSTPQLSVLPHLHLAPINLVIYKEFNNEH